MTAENLQSASPWLEQTRPRHAPLAGPTSCDVAIIGGGITGLTAALWLKQAGLRVVVLEKGRIGEAETGHTTAHLTYVTDTRLSELAKTFGNDEATLAWMGGELAIDAIEESIREHQIDCQFQRVPGYLHAPLDKKSEEPDQLAEEATLAEQLGFEATYLAAIPLLARPGVRFADQALFHPIQYLAGLARAIHGNGCAIHEESEVTEIKDDPLSLIVNGQAVKCQRLIIATHVPLAGLKNMVSATLFQSKLAGYSTYAIGASMPAGSLPSASFWDTSDPYYYLRIHRQGDRDHLVLGGEDHKTGQHDDAASRYQSLETLLHRIAPAAVVEHRWSGQVIETVDGLPYIGPTTDQQFIATGYAGNGMTFGTLAGLMARDWVMNQQNPWSELFSVDRKSIRGGAWEYLKENTSYPYHLIKGYLKGTTDKDPESVLPGEGCVMRVDGQRCAVSRDQSGELHVCSAVCTHMGCIVRWNKTESSWDCPCHGSRFTPAGEVIAGPAESPLTPHTVNTSREH